MAVDCGVETKLSKLKRAAAAEDWAGALRIASKFRRLGPHRDDILRAWEAIQRPEFYRAIGKDPATLVKAGVRALRARYDL